LQVAIIGAGIVGVTTAYELAVQGHEVTVFERRTSVAAETSFANAGILAPGYVTPWAAPGMPWKVLSHLLARDTPVRIQALGALRQLPWLWRWWRACRPRVHVANRTAMQGLAHFSRDRLQELTRTLNLEYEQANGYMVLMRTERELKASQRGLALLKELGVAHAVIDARRVLELEPALNPGATLHAAIHLPQDGLGNCRHFAHLLKAEAQKLGAQYRFDTAIQKLTPGLRPQLLTAGQESQSFDAVVVCAGVQANALLRQVGLKLPLAPVHGYSVTAPVRHVDGHAPLGPKAALMDERYKVAISRLGHRIRVAGSAEIGGRDNDMKLATLRTLYRVLDEWFPGSTVTREAQHWKGARPMLPDGPPVLGPSGAPGVWLNLGHGSSGWALSCGSARVLAECIGGRPAPIDISRLGLQRLGIQARA
jgi:D-amino-acid dehydrogenase